MLLQRLRHQRNILLARRLLLVVLLYPGFPVLARRAVFTAELHARNLGIAHFALLRRARRKVLHEGIGQCGACLAVEDKSLDALAALEREGHIAARSEEH